MSPEGEPDAGDLHVRFDERGVEPGERKEVGEGVSVETGLLELHWNTRTAPPLDPTAISRPVVGMGEECRFSRRPSARLLVK